MTSLIKEFSRGGSIQADLKTSDGSMAGTTDTSSKSVPVGFSLMRNTINADGQVSGSDVNDYLERAQDLNDEVESVGFAIETDDGDIIKVYVNAQEADNFEQELSKLLGLEGNFEEAINQLAQKYDIIDVVWPTDPNAVTDLDAGLSIDDTEDLGLGAEAPTETPDETEEIIDVPPAVETAAAEEPPVKDEGDEEIIDVPRKGEAAEAPEDTEAAPDETSEEDEMEPVLNADGTQKLDKDGNPVLRKKKKEKEPSLDDLGAGVTEEGFTLLGKLAEGARDEIDAHITTNQARGAVGMYFIKKTISGDTNGLRSAPVKRNGDVAYFEDLETARDEAARLTKQMNRAGASASYRYEPKLVEHKENDMTIGSQFLARLSEAKKTAPVDRDAVKDGMNIPLEAGHVQMITSLKRPLEKKIVALFAMAGIVGRLLKAEPDAIARIRERADMLRKNKAAQTAFNSFYNAFATARGFAPKVVVPKGELQEKHDPKRGSATQKKLEAVLVALGLPEGLITVKGPGILAPFIAAATLAIDQNGELKSKLIQLAIRLGVHGADAPEDIADDAADAKAKRTKKVEEGSVGGRFLSRLDELNPVKSNDPFAKDVIELLRALGVTEEHLGYKPQLLKTSLEKVGRSLKQRSLVDQRVGALTSMLKNGKKAVPQQQQPNQMEEGQLTEAFNELEAMTRADAHYFKLDEPAAGPAHMATYPGGNHEETVLTVGIDIQKEGNKTLRVGIDGPFDGELHTKYFTDDEAGYKDALKYANMLRTVNLKQGGRPKGWRE